MSLRRLLVWAALVGVLALGVWRPAAARSLVYSFVRERERQHMLGELQGYTHIQGNHFLVYYTKRDANVAQMVLDSAEAVYAPVINRFGYEPSRPIPLVLSPDQTTLQQSFGWSNGDTTMGVYWTGVIQVLSPNAWLKGVPKEQRPAAFHRLSPLAHELTHYLLDYKTGGNYPRWFTEGLAQRVEYQVTGYLWVEPESNMHQQLYTLAELQGDFDTLSNQALAYRESYLMVDYLARTWGDDKLRNLVGDLAGGYTFERALQRTTGMNQPQFEQAWRTWVADHLDQLDHQ